ncbi:MAG: glycerate kinase [Desulfovibrio sp.]|nr:glycerate kinase [Desulfovibrio sp.]
MHIVIAPDSFKESLSSSAVACAIEEGFRAMLPDASFQKIPLADGGEGTTEAIISANHGECIHVPTKNPLGSPITAFYGRFDKTSAVIEVAQASGLELLPKELRDPGRTSSYGTGLLLKAALDEGAKHIIIGLGGSATNDAGVGLLHALGAVFLDEQGQSIELNAEGLGALHSIHLENLDPRLSAVTIDVACDVDNPLYGEEGASFVFGPQKGGTKEQLALLDSHLHHFADLTKKQFGFDYAMMPGAGAAGGLGWALITFCNAHMRPGIDIVAEAVDLKKHIAACDLVVTGEGRLDGQTIRGKAPIGVAGIARSLGKPVLAIGGSVVDNVDAVYSLGIDAVMSTVSSPCSLEDCLLKARNNVTEAARRAARLLLLGKKLGASKGPF